MKERVSLETKDTRISLFLAKHRKTKTDITTHNLLPNFSALKLLNQRYEYVAVKYTSYIYLYHFIFAYNVAANLFSVTEF